MNRIALTLAAAVAFSACESVTTTAPSLEAPRAPNRQVVRNDHVESLVFGFNGCSGDFVRGTGKIHTVLGITRDGSGGFHVTSHQQFSNLQLTGFPSGAEYVGSQQANNSFNATAGVERTVGVSTKIIGKGQTPNAILHSTFHITINANGEVTSFHSNFSFDCH